MQHRNIPIFIPHLGCPNQCVFCNQRSISGCRAFREESVTEQIEAALATLSPSVEAQIAFFGGSFTGIDRGLMLRLLETAERYVRLGRVSSIRLSTRPDYISDEILEILSRYSVKTVELGLQSMDERVLAATKRGHSAETARRACRAVVDAGFDLVGQMMIGLPAATPESEVETAEEICRLGASAARIYPTVVFYDTPLCEMAQNGSYTPLSLDEAVTRSARALGVFVKRDIPVIRIGLCPTEDLFSPERVLDGPRHAALGELVWNAYYYCETLSALRARGLVGADVELTVPARAASKVAGQGRRNIERLAREHGTRVRRIIENENVKGVLPRAWQASQEQQEEERPCI